MTTMTTMTKSIILSKNNKKVAKTHKMLCILVAFWSHLGHTWSHLPSNFGQNTSIQT